MRVTMVSLEKALQGIGRLDEKAMRAARERQDRLTKPQGSLGRLEELSIRVAGSGVRSRQGFVIKPL